MRSQRELAILLDQESSWGRGVNSTKLCGFSKEAIRTVILRMFSETRNSVEECFDRVRGSESETLTDMKQENAVAEMLPVTVTQ